MHNRIINLSLLMLSTIQKKFGTDFSVINKLFSGGNCEVYIVKDTSSKRYALKLFKQRRYDSKLINEIEKGILLNSKGGEHFSFIKYISSESERLTKRTFIIYELAEKNTLKKLLINGKYFDENHALVIFSVVAKEVNELHKMGLAHMNIKLENILVDGDYNLKLAGFSQAQKVEKSDNNEEQNELYLDDIFRLGILLLKLITGKCDIKSLEKLLKVIQKGRYESFWKAIEIQNNQKFSVKLKELINILLTIKSNKDHKKWTLDEILNNKDWFNDIQMIKANANIYMKEKFEEVDGLD